LKTGRNHHSRGLTGGQCRRKSGVVSQRNITLTSVTDDRSIMDRNIAIPVDLTANQVSEIAEHKVHLRTPFRV